ncbi:MULTISPECIES: type I-E CRISPR-associated protein Cas7/Cse4/CasC [unclassified Variovorax]|uniref:type I-E CRISPR-associated protein Cas7/Cse4/CasC n=1 Tax=unclassified Variovorax TaxID=663243 RepID=UPI00076C4C9B|nr:MULTISPECIES: type I-E CRISPR-associated protein Cas7/Cse4/CasC [unclassified Variovorax]KWT98072.1 CRISPR-associated protein, Cse4 family [Variovorax sp. WDL1]PNG50454.1 CRISPR system Cascade subunit CasC [Variovorax sp. B2]PNG51327.1 CRISPR system Cascade subunit CasC [Variovorax sp. B4]VTU43248.1 CRISPR system Cascade subunit CasC [Variovorax sp. PBL-H6]VTU43350.1 CRISPR system Cascade subunit CasC [Variovorax sp. SRS16]
MTKKFIQIHALTAYGANNLNRDELSRPKSEVFCGVPRLRLSSQCLKRAYRTSEVMADIMTGTRSRDLWFTLASEQVALGHPEAAVIAHIVPVRDAFEGSKSAAPKDEESGTDDADSETPPSEAKKGKGGKKKKGAAPLPATLAELKGNLFYASKSEVEFIKTVLADSLNPSGSTKGAPIEQKVVEGQILDLLMSVDVAMFGRMVAGNKPLSVEGGVQAAHAFTVHKATADDDFFTAVDDISPDEGSGHMGSNGFGAGVYYSYFNVDVDVLLKNLNGDKALAARAIEAFIEAVATVAPGGKQNTFAARSYAFYLAVEVGNAQPRSYADAFAAPVKGDDITGGAVAALRANREAAFQCFPSQRTEYREMFVAARQGSLPEVQALVAEAVAA